MYLVPSVGVTHADARPLVEEHVGALLGSVLVTHAVVERGKVKAVLHIGGGAKVKECLAIKRFKVKISF